MKKIVLFANTSWYIYNFRMSLMKELSKMDYKIIVIAPQDKYSAMIPYEYHHIKMNNHGLNPLQDALTFIKIYKLLNKLKPDLILSYTIKSNIYGVIAASKLRINYVVNIAGLGTTFRKKSITSFFIRRFYRYAVHKADFIFFQNNEDLKLFTLNQKFNNFKLLPGSGVDLEKFKPKITNKNEKFTFLLLGRLLKEKGIYEFVESAKEVRKKYVAKFQLLGFIDSKNPIAIRKSEIDKWHENGVIEYLGFTNDVRRFILNADCVVLPSYYGEGVPKSLLEAASMGIPLITTDHTGCREVVEDGVNGFICQPRNIYDLSKKMIKMLNLKEEELKKMGLKSREKVVRSFDEKIVLDAYKSLVQKLIGTSD
ncbi:MAG: glycosyltransferase family 4 protein [Candidatus Cloacimonadota bacterium]|nr:glycosyltransferase family 4 protein [Candidatus Cloacimonadota bacterium]